MTKPPNSSCTGSHLVLTKKLKPYLLIAGHALMVRVTRIATSKIRVMSADALAA